MNTKPNVSIICACKNRYEPLKVSLISWLNFDEVKEVIIVDWNSNEPINHLTKLDSRIKVIRVENELYFNQPQPLNLAAKLATQDFILKLDADYIMNPYYRFFDHYNIDEKTFIFGPDNENESYINDSPYFKYLRGLLYIKRENFLSVGGYNENMDKYYAWEDDELIKRLRLYGLNSVALKYDHNLFHIPHPDGKRVENFQGDVEEEQKIIESLSKIYSGDELKWQSEYAISQYHLTKNAVNFEPNHYYHESSINWNIVPFDEQNYFAEKISNENCYEYQNSPLKYFPSVYYVSLEESKERRDNLVKQFNNYGITDVTGVISKRYKDSQDIVIGKYIHQLNDGTKGCAVSHLKALKEWYYSSNDDYVFVCEDDLSLETVKYWKFTWEDFVESIPEDADCVQLMTIRGKYDTFNIRERYYDDWGASAYIATREYVRKIIDAYCLGDTYKLEVVGQEIMPLIENLLFVGLGKVYTIPLFVEDNKFPSTFSEEEDTDVRNGQKNNHIIASQLVLDYWKNGINFQKNEIEELLTDYSLDTENPINNFKLGYWYWKQEHTAPALSYFLRCAERADDLLAYEALIWASFCYDKQGTRDGSAKVLLQQAITLIPTRPEAYFLLSRFCERREWWQESYIMASQGLIMADFGGPSLNTFVEYPGKYGLIFEKAISAWWWGKHEESKTLLNSILEEYDNILPEYQKSIKENLERIGK